MAVKIKERNGLDDYETVAVWEDGEWTEGEARFLKDEQLQEYGKEQILNHFTGPNLFAVIEASGQQTTIEGVNDGD